MRINCPFCGERGHAEFAYLGDAGPTRPRPGARAVLPDPALFVDYVYLRTNPPGLLQEYWQHVGGCRAWLIVERDVTSHAILGVAVARDRAIERAESEPA